MDAAAPAISSNLPAPIKVAGSGRSRRCRISPTTFAPAVSASVRSSARDSSASNSGMLGLLVLDFPELCPELWDPPSAPACAHINPYQKRAVLRVVFPLARLRAERHTSSHRRMIACLLGMRTAQ